MAPLPRDRDKLSRMEQAVRVLIHGLGEDLDREGLRDTPKRVAKALLDCTQGYHQDTTSTLGTALFHEPIVHHGGEGLVVVRDIDFASTSEETLLPFHGRCHVAYRPKDGVVLGLSKLARLTKQYAKRLQTQERLAAAIALALQQSLECHGVAVVLQARHLSNNCPPDERSKACVSGVFASKGSPELEELLALLGLEDLPPTAIASLDSSPPALLLAHNHLPPSASARDAGSAADPGVPAPGTPDPSEKDTDGDSDDLVLEASCCCEEMEAAVQQLLLELGEDPHRPGLAGAARRYVTSLLASTSGYNMPPPIPLVAVTRLPAQQEKQQGALHQDRSLPLPLLLASDGAACAVEQGNGSVSGEGADVGGGEGRRLPAAGAAAALDTCSRARCCGRATGSNGVGGEGRCVEGHQYHHDHHTRSSGRSGCLAGAAPPAPANAARSSCSVALGSARIAGHVAADSAVSAPGCCAYAAACCRSHPLLSEATAAGAAEVGPLRGAVTLRMRFTSQCEHHMLPFYGSLMVSYFPGAEGAAAVLRAAVEAAVLRYTQRLQVQERITHQVADAVEEMLRISAAALPSSAAAAADEFATPSRCGAGGAAAVSCRDGGAVASGTRCEAGGAQVVEAGVMVVCDAAHMCMVARGVENHSGSTTTFAVRGAFAARPELRRAVLRLFREQ